MSMPEQTAKVATTAIDALKGNPGLLVLVLLQLTTMAMLIFVNDRQNTRRAAREMAMLERCFPHLEKTELEVMQSQLSPKE